MPRIPHLSAIAVISLLVNAVLVTASTSKQTALQSTPCEDPPYRIHVLSKRPLVIYISDFVTEKERQHVQELTKSSFTRSSVADETGTKAQRQTRTSQSASVPRDDIVRCIENRALSFQGFDIPRSHLESLQLVKYGTGEKYQPHTDWFEAESLKTAEVGGNRETSFFAYIAVSNITGGGTNFPLLDAPREERWCEYIDCDEPWENGVTFRPVSGNAVFWQNLAGDGTGDHATLHAGLPVTSGNKIGMNIWTRQWPLSSVYRGVDD
ncbi:hypothetical protein HYFRA_00014089 [Hymenoscyphus fraxineus]|uniref:Prolyl 4-hydroxylase alpha subunit domain-containing protein n=1 Tax=Hymenoscyphus fraxineus TaxID=746836 RepID=A0A9N9L7Y6_9HELO|nr:hypothetical protein HYFRA_00014089 [Hymenoscyphus fraxineus]